jgi:hypothetical protein
LPSFTVESEMALAGRNRNSRFGVRNGNKMVYRGGCVAEYVERSPSTYDEQIGVA